MAEAQNPVIVEDDDKKDASPTNNRTVGQMIDAGEVALAGEGQTTTDESGTLKIPVTPVTLEPAPKASVPTQVRVTPTVPPVTFKSLQPEVTESVTTVKQPPRTYEDILKALDAGESVNIEGPQGTETYSGRNAARLARTPGYTKKIKIALATENNIKAQRESQEFPEDPQIAFLTPTGGVDVSYLDPDLQDTAEVYALGRKALDDTLRPLVNTGRKDIDVAVRQYFVDDFTTGEFVDNLLQRLAETGRAIPTLPYYGYNLVGSAGEALARSLRLGTSFSEEWTALADKRQDNTKNYLENLSTVLDAPTVAIGLNEALRDRIRNDPNLSDKQKDDFLFDTTVTGEKFLREFVDDETAYAVLEESFNQMNGIEQFGVIFLENMLGGGILSRAKNARALDEAKRVEQLRKSLGLADDLSLAAVARIARQRDAKLKLDDDLLELGAYNLAISRQMDEAGTVIKKLRTVDLPDAALKFGKDSLEYRRIESEILNLQRMRRRNYLRQTISPYFTEVIGDELALAIAATMSRQHLTGFMGMDGETAELVGIVGGLGFQLTGITDLAKRGIGATARVAGVTTGGIASRITPDGILNPTTAIYRKLMQADTTVEDYEELYFKPQYRRGMNRNERKMVKAAFTQVERMDEITRERFLNQLQGQMNLQDELLKMFPEGEARDTAADFLSQSFAEASALPNAIAAYQLATDNVVAKGIKKGGIGGMLNAAADVERRLARAQVLIDGFETHVAKFGDPNQTEAVTSLIQQTRASLLSIEEMMDMEFNKLNKNLDSMITSAIEDISEPMDEDFYEAFKEAKDIINARVSPETAEGVSKAVGEVGETRELIVQTTQAFLERFETIRSIRDRRTLHSRSLDTAVESLMFQRYGALSAEMDKPYEAFRKFVAETDRPMIDISPAVNEMLSIADARGDITTFFGPQSVFFSGYLGRKSRRMFERMVTRTIDGLPEDERKEMFTALVEAGVDPDDLEMMLRNDPVRFGLMLQESGRLNVFANANIEEAEEFRRAFRDYGYKTSNKAVAREFREFEKIIDEAIETSDPEGHAELIKARGIYQQLNDPLRPGSPLNRMLGSKVGDKVTADSGPYSGMYKGQTPAQIIGEIGVTVDKIMQGGRGKFKNVQKLREQIGALEQLFGTPGEGGVMRIDLRTEEGQLGLELIEEVIGALVYDGWAADFLTYRPAVGQRLGDPRKLGFKTSVIDELEGINDVLNINVTDLNGKPDSVLAFNISDMISQEKDISKMIMEGGALFARGQKAVSTLKNNLNAARDEVKTRIKYDTKAMDALQSLTNLKDPGAFYKEFIGQDAYGDIDLLRDQFMTFMRRDKDMEGVDLEKLFDNAMYNVTYRGLMEVGGYGPVGRAATSELKGLLGENITVNGFANTLGALAELENAQVVKNLEKIMPPEHVESVKNIFTYLANQQAAGTAVSLAAKGMSANEALSRAYNIAREMVSPTYVASEVTIRLLQKKGADALLLSLQSPDAAAIMDKILRFPKLVTPKELKTFDTLLQEFLFTEVARKGQEATLTDYFNVYLGEEESTNEDE